MYDLVREFHKSFGHPVGDKPQFLTPERLEVRLGWQDEERKEFDEAVEAKDLTKAADALADQIYFILGTAVEMGLPMKPIFWMVHRANMNKMAYTHFLGCKIGVETKCDCGAIKYDENGKVVKPEGWTAPDADIGEMLKRLGG